MINPNNMFIQNDIPESIVAYFDKFMRDKANESSSYILKEIPSFVKKIKQPREFLPHTY